MDIRVKIKHTQRKKLLLLPISFWPRQMSVFSLKQSSLILLIFVKFYEFNKKIPHFLSHL